MKLSAQSPLAIWPARDDAITTSREMMDHLAIHNLPTLLMQNNVSPAFAYTFKIGEVWGNGTPETSYTPTNRLLQWKV